MYAIRSFYIVCNAKDLVKGGGWCEYDYWSVVDRGSYEIEGTYDTYEDAYEEWKDFFSESQFEPDTSWSEPEVQGIVFDLISEDVEGALDYSCGTLSEEEILSWFPELKENNAK